MAVFVIPAYNEEANVPRLLADLERRPDLWNDGGYVILVDDGSTDGTVEAARAHDGDLPVQVLEAERNQGPGKAFDRGFRRALTFAREDELIVTLESDTTSDLTRSRRCGRPPARAPTSCSPRTTRAASWSACPPTGASSRAPHRRHPPRRPARRQHRVLVLPGLPASALHAGYESFGDAFIRERGFACKAEILMKLSRLGITIAETRSRSTGASARARAR